MATWRVRNGAFAVIPQTIVLSPSDHGAPATIIKEDPLSQGVFRFFLVKRGSINPSGKEEFPQFTLKTASLAFYSGRRVSSSGLFWSWVHAGADLPHLPRPLSIRGIEPANRDPVSSIPRIYNRCNIPASLPLLRSSDAQVGYDRMPTVDQSLMPIEMRYRIPK
jgi:hypothetical protein